MRIDVCLSPSLYEHYAKSEAIVVLIDAVRASATICAAFTRGTQLIYTVPSSVEALKMKSENTLIAGERNGFKIEGFDFGNSPYDFLDAQLNNKQIVFTTTNGTQAIEKVKEITPDNRIIIGAFVNFDKVIDYLIKNQKHAILLCAGWKNKVNIEDTLFAGKVAEKLLKIGNNTTKSDAVYLATNVFSIAKKSVFDFVMKHSPRFQQYRDMLENDIKYCLTDNIANVLPVMHKDGYFSL